MDKRALARENRTVSGIMRLWDNAGELTLSGPEPIGKRVFQGREQMSAFYMGRGKGIPEHFSTLFAQVNVVNAKSGRHIVVSGVRYMVNARGEGAQAPFTHNFQFDERGKISSLHINVGTPSAATPAAFTATPTPAMARARPCAGGPTRPWT